MTSERRSRAQWKRIVRQWKSSGQSAKAFAAEHELNPSTLYWWSRHLKREALVDKPVSFVPVEITQVASSAVITLELSATRMHVPVGADIAYVTSLLSALRASEPRC